MKGMFRTTLLVMGMALMSRSALANQANDTSILVQRLTTVHQIACEGSANVTVRLGQENAVRKLHDTDGQLKDGDIVQKGTSLVLGNNVRVELLLTPTTLSELSCEDNVVVKIESPEVFEATYKMTAEDNARVYIATNRKWEVDEMRITAEDNAMVSVGDTAMVKTMTVHADDNSHVVLGCAQGNTIETYKNGNARVFVDQCSFTNTYYSSGSAHKESVIDSFFDGLSSGASKDDELAGDEAFHIYDDMDLRFLWGFTNWGNQWYGGLQGCDGANGLRTSFSYYGLELSNALFFAPHWSFELGIGYESSVYKFNNPLVLYDPAAQAFNLGTAADGNMICNGADELDKWSTRLVARYVTLPIGFKTTVGKFDLGLYAIPGLNYTGKHTGLKHEYDTQGKNFADQDKNPESQLAPYKCDVRLMLGFKGLNVFLQVPTMPVATFGGQKMYPIKIGFAL